MTDTYRIPRWFVGIVTIFITLAVPWCVWVTKQLMDQKVSFAVESNTKAIQNIVEQHNKDQEQNWTIAKQSEYILRLAIKNPGMEYPDPRDPDKVISVQKVRITNAKIDPDEFNALCYEYGLSRDNESNSGSN